ncbi:hypothetical protein D3C86_2207100 [compost metagenome]
MIGWTKRPVAGAAIHSMASSLTSAPRVWKIRLVLTFCSPQTIWTPNRPQHMFQICEKDSRALVMRRGSSVGQ